MNNQNNKKPANKSSLLIVWVVIAAVMAFSAADGGEGVFAAVAVILLVAVIVLVTGAVKKAGQKTDQKPGQNKTADTRLRPNHAEHPAGKPAFLTHRDEKFTEEAVTCRHATGKETYIQQLDSYLKAGLIDKAEYKLMKERYQKLEIPEDYH